MFIPIILFCMIFSVEGKIFENFTKLEKLIVGGESRNIEDVPYQVAFYYNDYYFCSGSTVSKNHIVSAAHCLMIMPSKPKGLTIRAGSSKIHGGKSIKVKKIILHPKFKFKKSGIDYDVAVAKLDTPLEFCPEILPIRIGNFEPKEGQEVQVSGWGYLKEYGPPSRKLRSVRVNVVSRNICEKNYKNYIQITSRMICARAKDKDACYGDSGGPLVFQSKLVGIVSTGEGCARKNFPGIYTNVPHPEVSSFIQKEIET